MMVRRERGQAIVEFMLVIGIFLALVLWLVCIGQILLAGYTVNQAARAAAHQAALAGGASATAYDAAAAVLNAGVGTRADAAQVRIACLRTPCRRYDPITVNIAYRGAYWAPVAPFFNEFTLESEAVRAAERDQQ
ncbi:MAG: pilus assembly protein [Chloroflexia bacterium]|nr:pilus assembly protein [Chloroflexia bacterium]